MHRLFTHLACLLLCLIPFLGFSDNNQYRHDYGYYTFIYQITNKQAEKLIDYEKPDSTYWQNIVDSVPAFEKYEKQLTPGHYLKVTPVQWNLKYELISEHSFEAVIVPDEQHLIVQVYRKQDRTYVKNANVSVGKAKFNFDSNNNNYTCKTRRRYGTVKVEVNGEMMFLDMDIDKTRQRSKLKFVATKLLYSFPLSIVSRPARKLYYAIRYNGWRGIKHMIPRPFRRKKRYGYLALNQPMYRHGDTVHIKAYITKYKRNALRRDLDVWFANRYDVEDRVLLGKVSPTRNGYYEYSFVLGDTLKLDKNYTVYLGDKKQFGLVSNSFRLEDYQLNQITYKIRTGKKYYEYGESIQLCAEGKDINALTIPDGRVDLTITPGDIRVFYSDTVRVSETTLEKTFPLDPLGETKITIPANELPNCKVLFKVVAQFNNSNNETFDTTFYINYNGQPDLIDVRSQKGVITANLIKGGIPYKGFATMYGVDHGDTLYKKRVSLPWEGDIDQKINSIYFKNAEVDGQLNFPWREDSLECFGYLRNDTLVFGATNPRKVDFEYRIYKQDRLVKSGTQDDFPLLMKHKGTSTYTMNVQYYWGGNIQTDKIQVAQFNKFLNVNVTQPKIVQPGDSVDIEVEVTNGKGKPVKNIDVTAGAITKEFERDNKPHLPYLGKRRRSRAEYRSYSATTYNVKRTIPLTVDMRKRYHLDTIPWYQLMYPKGGMAMLYHDIDSGLTQFSPYVVRHNVRGGIFFIYLDGELIFSETATVQQPYAFRATPGYHEVKLRTAYSELTIDSVLMKQGKKLELCIDLRNAPNTVSYKSMPDTITYDEQRLLDRHMVTIRNNHNGRKWLKQGERVHELHGSARVYVAGPFRRDTIEYIVERDTMYKFVPEWKYEHLITSAFTKLYEPDPNPNKKHRLRNFTYWSIGTTAKDSTDIVLKAATIQPKEVKPWFKKMPTSTASSRGEYQIEINTDSTVSLIRLQHLDNNSQHPIYKGYTRKFYNLMPGFYELQLYTPNGYTWKQDSIKIVAGTKFFQRLDAQPFEGLPSVEWFVDSLTSTFGRDSSAYKISYSFTHKSLRGFVYDLENKMPIPFATIRLLQNGNMVAGTTTDFDGLFQIPNPGDGRFTIEASCIGYEKRVIDDVLIKPTSGALVHFGMYGNIGSLEEFEVVAYSVPLIEKEYATLNASMITINSNDITSAYSVLPGVTSVPSVAGEAHIVSNGIDVTTQPDLTASLVEEAASAATSTGLKLRTEFRDYAFFEHMVTDKDGKARATVKFPDNITAWKTNALAMNARRQTGSGSTVTKAYKQLTAQAALPRFLIAGDESEVIGKSMNYDPAAHAITTFFMMDDDTLQQNDTTVTNAVIDRMRVTASQTKDSAAFTYFLSRADGYIDGERRSIPIFPRGSKEHRGTFMILENDTTITIRIDTFAKGKVTVTAFDNQLNWLMDQTHELKNYPYACMEQTASKLRGYLAAANIESLRKKAHIDPKPIWELIRRLEDNQKYDGSWGWWPSSPTNTYMTCYVMDALWEAKNQGYVSKAIEKGEKWLIEEAELAQGQELVDVLNVLAKMDAPVVYERLLLKAKPADLSMYARFQEIEIRQLQNLPYSLDLLDTTRIETLFGNYYWGTSYYSWYGNRYTLTLLAYKILERENLNDPTLARIRDYFLEDRKKTQYMNTIQQATLVQTLLPSIMRQYGTNFEPVKVVFAKDNAGPWDAPFKRTFDQSEGEITLTKTGSGPLYLSVDQQFWNPAPDSVGKTYAVESWFTQNDAKVDTLTAGKPVDLVVKVEIKKTSDYMMIEVPIPAGCSYHGNGGNSGWRETHRERFKNKTAIFCQSLPAGTYMFKVALQPRYSGRYHLNPVHVEQMYFPVFFGRGTTRETSIR